jgi:hypothetical protein
MEDDNNNIFIGSTLFSIKSDIGSLKALASTEKAKIILDCLMSLVKSLTDSDFEGEGTHEQNME